MTPYIETLQEQFDELKELLTAKIAGDLEEDGEAHLKDVFKSFIHGLEFAHVDLFDNPAAQEELLNDMPGVKPYWTLIKEMQKHDSVMFKTLDADQAVTRNNVQKMAASPKTLAFIKKNQAIIDDLLVGGEELFQENSANIKMLRVAQFLAYAWSGKGSAFVDKLQTSHPGLSDARRHKEVYQHFQRSIHYLSLSPNKARWYDIHKSRRGQPPGKVTDGMLFMQEDDGLQAWMVFATANSDLRSQHRQLFDYPKWLMDNASTSLGKTPVDLKDIKEVTPILACLPIAAQEGIENGVNKIFKNAPFTKMELQKMNAIPLMSQMGNIDNSESIASLDTLMKTVYFTVGGGEEPSLKADFKALLDIGPPERHQRFLAVCARKLVACSNILSKKTNACQNDGVLHKAGLSPDVIKMMNGLTGCIAGLAKHSAVFKEEPNFIEGLATMLGSAHKSLTTFVNALDPTKITDIPAYDSFSDAIAFLEPETFKKKVSSTRVATPSVKSVPVDFEIVRDKAIEYYQTVVKPEQQMYYKQVKFQSHFLELVTHKVNNGEESTFTAVKGDLSQSAYQAILHFTNEQSDNYKGYSPYLNDVVREFLTILKTNDATQSIVDALQSKIDYANRRANSMAM